ncbi:type II toxin-antitoxin system VapC family toxin [Glaciihabitans sp. UYNi722]|uniref:type II toxin-antitoxin system VapC family toxin n=1 Tax=Glaciihabitans sp. UYNi722 TaxID=3156344 RepID=UPI00339098EB
MRLLLDTHVLLWWLTDDPKLNSILRDAIADGGNEVFVSSVSVTEIAIKQSRGKLQAPRELLLLLSEAGFTELPLTSAHGQVLRDLPPHHRDPFDRMLIAQAQVEGLEIATADADISSYDVDVLAN